MELKDLKGKRVLTGFDTCIPNKKTEYKDFENGVCFIIDGIKYQVYEDPNDGYRSYASDLLTEDIECKNNFEGIDVLCIYRSNYKYSGDSDMLDIYSIKTEELIAQIGTENVDDYYPCCNCKLFVEQLDKEIKGEE